MTPDYSTILSGMFALQSAALSAALATSGRLAGFALREAEIAAITLLEPLRAPAELRQCSWEAAVRSLCEQNAEAFRLLAGCPQLSLLLFVGQLDMVRGPRPTASASARIGE